MKKLFFILCFICCYSAARADSTDMWRVYYNNIQLKEHHALQHEDPEQIIFSGVYADGVVKIVYFHVRPLQGERTLSLQDENGKIIYSQQFKDVDTDLPMFFNIAALYRTTFSFNKFYNVYLREKVNGQPDLNVLLFRMKIKA